MPGVSRMAVLPPSKPINELWNDPMKADYISRKSKNSKQVDDNCPTIMNMTQSAVMGLPGAQQQVDTAKQAVQQGNDALQRDANFLDSHVQTLTRNLKTVRDQIESDKRTESDLKTEVSKTSELNSLRQEQSIELKKKYTSSFHTSWLGLWRPLKETTPMGLIVASVVFGLIGIASIIFYIKEVALKSGTSATKPIGPVLGKMVGGFLKQFL